MTCDDRRELMLPYLADCLEPAEEALLRAHLREGCPRCSEALAEAQATLDQLTMAIEPVTPSPDVRNRLIHRIEVAERESGAKPHGGDWNPIDSRTNRTVALRRSALVWHSIPAALAAAMAIVVTWGLMAPTVSTQERMLSALEKKLESLEGLVERRETRTERLATRVAELDSLEQLLRSRSMRVVQMSGGDANPDAWGRLAVDLERKVCHVVTGRLGPVEPGRTYSFWFGMEDQTRHPIGPISVDDSGAASFWVEMPPESDRIVSAGISCDPIGEDVVDEPSGLTLFGSLR